MEKYIERPVSRNDAEIICKKIAEVEAAWRKANRQDAEISPPRGQEGHRGKKALSGSFLIGMIMILMWPLHGPVRAGELPYALGYDVVGQTEQVLKRAASASPQWHSRQDAIQRDIYDITFLVEQAVRASEKLNDAAKHDYAQQALTLLQRAVRRGHFDPNSIEPVLKVIGELLPNTTA